MKKHAIIFQKLGKISIPVYREQFNAMLDDVKDKDFFQGVFFKPKKPKSNEQLGYLYANKDSEGVYAFMARQFREQWGELYTISLKVNVTNIDICMKELFCKHKGIKEFNKTNASTEDLKEYIKFIDDFSIENFGCELPPPKKQ